MNRKGLEGDGPGASRCTDYKIFTSALSTLLGTMLDHMIHPDQTYAIPGWTIYNNVHLVQNIIGSWVWDGLCHPDLTLYFAVERLVEVNMSMTVPLVLQEGNASGLLPVHSCLLLIINPQVADLELSPSY
eukprot:g31369.t1